MLFDSSLRQSPFDSEQGVRLKENVYKIIQLFKTLSSQSSSHLTPSACGLDAESAGFLLTQQGSNTSDHR